MAVHLLGHGMGYYGLGYYGQHLKAEQHPKECCTREGTLQHFVVWHSVPGVKHMSTSITALTARAPPYVPLHVGVT